MTNSCRLLETLRLPLLVAAAPLSPGAQTSPGGLKARCGAILAILLLLGTVLLPVIAHAQQTPSAPRNFRIVEVTANSVKVAWQRSSIQPSGTVYWVIRRGDSWKQIPAGREHYDYNFTGLATGSLHTFRVQAINESKGSATITVTATTGKPGTPSLTVEWGNQKAVLSWTASGGTETSWRYQSKTTGGYSSEQDAGGLGAREKEVTGLTNGANYTIRLRAGNGAGNSAWAMVTGRPGAPGAPLNLTAKPADQSVSLSWTAPATGGSAAGYEVRWKQASDNNYNDWQENGLTTSYNVTGLTNNTVYDFQVRGENLVKGLTASVSAAPTTPPGAPGDLRTVEGDKQLTLHWSAPGSGGPPTGYEYRRKSGGGNYGRWIGTGAGIKTEYVMTDLTNNTVYNFEVRATNAAGNGAVSGEASGAPKPPQAKLYWTDNASSRKKVQRANPDGTTVEDIVTGLDVGYIAVDAGGGKIYWTDGTDKIRRANLDGSSAEDLVTGLGAPVGIAIDAAGGKMYWSDRDTAKIQRANLDGSSVEGLVTMGLSNVIAIALDVTGGKIYWVQNSDRKLYRANMVDGSSREEVRGLGFGNIEGLALDVAAGKAYYTALINRKILRINLDGTGSREDLVTESVFGLRGIALDVAGRKMYWGNFNNDRIRRADLDGSNAEDLVTTGLLLPHDVALLLKPGKPRDLTAAGGEQVTLSWKAPTPDAGGSAASYEYRYKTTAGYTNWADAGTGISTVVTGLTINTAHTFQVRALNLLGGGPESDTATSTAPMIKLRLRVFLEGPLK